MPTYEYKCDKCGHHFELFQKMTDPPVKICPVCKGKVTRLISGGAGFIFKGSGFYITDYKKKPETADTRKDKQPEGTTTQTEKQPKVTGPKETKPAKETKKQPNKD